MYWYDVETWRHDSAIFPPKDMCLFLALGHHGVSMSWMRYIFLVFFDVKFFSQTMEIWANCFKDWVKIFHESFDISIFTVISVFGADAQHCFPSNSWAPPRWFDKWDGFNFCCNILAPVWGGPILTDVFQMDERMTMVTTMTLTTRVTIVTLMTLMTIDKDDHINKHDNNDDNNDDNDDKDDIHDGDNGGDEDDHHHTRKLTVAILVMWPGRLSIVQRDNTNCTNCWFVKIVCFWIVRGTTILLCSTSKGTIFILFSGDPWLKNPECGLMDRCLPHGKMKKNQCCWGVFHDLQQLCFFSWCGHA